jgi:hypothetical protein
LRKNDGPHYRNLYIAGMTLNSDSQRISKLQVPAGYLGLYFIMIKPNESSTSLYTEVSRSVGNIIKAIKKMFE